MVEVLSDPCSRNDTAFVDNLCDKKDETEERIEELKGAILTRIELDKHIRDEAVFLVSKATGLS